MRQHSQACRETLRKRLHRWSRADPTFFSVMLPCAPPALMIVFLFSFVWRWNDYFYTSIYMAGTNVLPMALSQLRQDFITQLGSPIVNAGSVMFILPILIIFAFLQRYFVESVDRTGLVG